MNKIFIVLASSFLTYQLFGMQCSEKELYGDKANNKKGMMGLLEDFKNSIRIKIPADVPEENKTCEVKAYENMIIELEKIQIKDETSIYFPETTLNTMCSEALAFCSSPKIDNSKLLLEYLSVECGFKENLELFYDNCSNYL